MGTSDVPEIFFGPLGLKAKKSTFLYHISKKCSEKLSLMEPIFEFFVRKIFTKLWADVDLKSAKNRYMGIMSKRGPTLNNFHR